MTFPNNETATFYFVDDVPGASVPASRLNGILAQMKLSRPLTVLQQHFLRQHGYDSLLRLSLGELDFEAFRVCALAEQVVRIKSTAAADSAARKEEEIENDRRAEVTRRKNAAVFAELEIKRERKRKLRELPDRYGLGFVERRDFGRVNLILKVVSGGQPLEKFDLLWLGSVGRDYWSDGLQKAHHENMARRFRTEWEQTGDVWKAINACGHFRKAARSSEGLKLAEAGLAKTDQNKVKQRSALLTTGGGALRDLGRHEDAVQFGNEAHALTPKDFRPCTLLGAVHIEMGAYITGAEWYKKAEALGASRNSIDRELQSILAATSPEKRAHIKRILKAHDSARYDRL